MHIAPFGAILTANHWGKEPMYESLVEWDANLNQARPRRELEIVDPQTVDFTLRRGVRFHNGKEVTAADVKYSVEGWLNPPLPEASPPSARCRRSSPEVRIKYVFLLHLKQSDARVFGFLAWQRYAPIVPEGLYEQINVGREGIGTGPYRLVELHAGTGYRVRRVRELLEEGPAVPEPALAAEDPRTSRPGSRRCGPGRSTARRSRSTAPGRSGNRNYRRAERADGRLPRAADDDQDGREQAVARPARAAGGHLRDQPPGHHRSGSTTATASTRATCRPATARGR